MLTSVQNWLDGKKTYIVAALIGIGAGLEAYGIMIPEFVFMVLGALGLGAVRAGVKKSGPVE